MFSSGSGNTVIKSKLISRRMFLLTAAKAIVVVGVLGRLISLQINESNKYKTLSPNAIGSFKVYATAIHGLDNNNVRLSKRVTLPTTKLRGFESGKVGPKDGKDFVGGNYGMTTNFEVALPNLLPEATKTDVGLFLDFGNLWSVDYDDSLDDSNKIRSTAGINTSWLSPVGPMTFTFAQNLSKVDTDKTQTFNFNLGTTF